MAMSDALDIKLVMYFVPMLMIWVLYLRRQRNRQEQVIALRDAARRDGLTEPASLHPIIDPVRCIGCGSCVNACPENTVLGLIEKAKTKTVKPTVLHIIPPTKPRFSIDVESAK